MQEMWSGNYVPLVLWFNFFSGFLYVLAGIGLARCHDWSWRLATGIAILTILVFVYLGFHVFFGGAFENRTILAMVLRSGFWVFMARFSYLQHNLKV